ncbi:hypothetical protein AB6A40_005162 [Gnathostoma spinigerum]|uniref:Uncharacterized protein n=1 Tax=Gnathostoma spinigerum TaxID=75299 RepID=A0ABD6EET0_9BILA
MGSRHVSYHTTVPIGRIYLYYIYSKLSIANIHLWILLMLLLRLQNRSTRSERGTSSFDRHTRKNTRIRVASEGIISK